MIKLTDRQWERIRHHFPEENRDVKARGRPPVPSRNVLDAVLWILKSGAQWYMLPQCYPNYKTVHRRFPKWNRAGVLANVLKDFASELREAGKIGTSEAYIDGSFVRAKGGGAGVGLAKSGKGAKIMVIVDRSGLPLSIASCAANHHEVKLVQLSLDLVMVDEKPTNLIGDKAYDGDPLDEDLRQQGVEMIAPHRKGRGPLEPGVVPAGGRDPEPGTSPESETRPGAPSRTRTPSGDRAALLREPGRGFF